MYQVFFKQTEKDGKQVTRTKNLSVREAHDVARRNWKHETEKATEYEFFRTEKFVIYNPNRKQKTRAELRFVRAFPCIVGSRPNAGQLPFEYIGMLNYVIHAPGEDILVLSHAKNEEDVDFHTQLYETQFGIDNNVRVVCLTHSDVVPYVKYRNEAVRELYKNYDFPAWFKPFIKHRHFRQMNYNGSFNFMTRTYADSARSSSAEKYRRDMFRRGQFPAKNYFSLARMVDPLSDDSGNGRPFDRILEVYDIDADKDHKIHYGPGPCNLCLNGAKRKLERFLTTFQDSILKDGYRVLFSGKKGFHVHLLREISEAQMLENIATINAELPNIIDDFTFEDDDGELRFDMHRIFKVPGTVDMTTGHSVTENSVRTDVLRDELIIPKV